MPKRRSGKAGRKVSACSRHSSQGVSPTDTRLTYPAGTPRDLLASDIGNEVHVGSSMSGDGERRIDYHVFEIEVDPDALCDDW